MTHEEMNHELTANGIKFSRKDYMNGICSHDEYYSQFVTDGVIRTLERHIGKAEIEDSTDPHFNDIPLGRWDALALLVPQRLISVSNVSTQADGSSPSISLSDRVCILKAAAKIIRDRAKA